MSSQIESFALPPAVRRIASAFRITGHISFWAQLVLGVVSTFILLFAGFSLNNPANAANPGTGFGLLFAAAGIAMVFAGAYWSFFSYIRLSRLLRSADAKRRPKPKDATQSLRIGLSINLLGMLFTLLGGQAITGVLLGKAISQPQGGAIFAERLTQFVQAADILMVQANINTILAHFVGIVASLWLIRTMSRQ